MTKVLLWDETTAGRRFAAGELSMDEERLSLREIIRHRVFREPARYEADSAGNRAGFRRPGRPASRDLDLDLEKQYALAIGAFARNGLIVFVDDRQIEDLDEPLDLRADIEVVFLELVALVGG